MKRTSAPLTIISRVLLFLLIAVCLTSHLTTGLSARFTSAFGGDGSARVAKFGGAKIYYDALNVDLTGSTLGYYAIVASFRIVFDASEVARQYSLVIRFDDDASSGASLIHPAETVRVLSGGSSTEASTSALGFSGAQLSSGNAYYSHGVGSQSSVLQATAGTKARIELTKDVGMEAETHYFQIVIFEKVVGGSGDDLVAEDKLLHLMADLVIEQVD